MKEEHDHMNALLRSDFSLVSLHVDTQSRRGIHAKLAY